MCWQTKLICISYKSKNFFMPLLHWMNWSSIVPIQSSFLAKLWSKCDEIWVLILNEITTTTTTPPPSRQRDDRFDSRVHQQLTACYLPDIRLPAEITHGYIRTHTHTHTEFLWQSPPALFIYIYIHTHIPFQRKSPPTPYRSLPTQLWTTGQDHTRKYKYTVLKRIHQRLYVCACVCVCARTHTYTHTQLCHFFRLCLCAWCFSKLATVCVFVF